MENNPLTNSTPGAWGDMGNGSYKNPVLNADYSDPDVIRVGIDFYMVCSEFHYMGMPVLHSKDLVNWTIIAHVYNRLDIDERYDNMDGYGKGSWAPSIRYHNGEFYVYFCTPREGLYMSKATNPAGPWSPLHEVKRVARWEDPCPFWDDDGTAYLGHSVLGAGPIILHKMSPDGTTLLDDGVTIYEGPVAEGTKIHKRNGYYYLSIPEGGVSEGYQTVLRSGNIYGPYERKVVLKQGSTEINGPHQGALIELENGETWFYHFQSVGALGRVCHLQPVEWVDDWPMMGINNEPVMIHKKPAIDGEHPITAPQTSDEFEGESLGLGWQWNHNPADSDWSLTERKGYFRIKAKPAQDLLLARNTITQKIMGNRGVATTELSVENMALGQVAGLAFISGKQGHWIGVEKCDDGLWVSCLTEGVSVRGPKLSGDTIWLRAEINVPKPAYFSYSFDGEKYIRLGEGVILQNGFWKGARLGLFSFNGSGGSADFNRFIYLHDGPCGGLL
ncbi:MAG: Beta-xylosidase [Firmicutes bacterium ADurb.Bin193]|nr:MAG: Beta-xylosidase [Firmicutes bacterium ADurb.Bin193]